MPKSIVPKPKIYNFVMPDANTKYVALKDFISLNEDGELFRFWIHMAAKNPCRIANAISMCITAEDYRIALTTLLNEVNLEKTSSES